MIQSTEQHEVDELKTQLSQKFEDMTSFIEQVVGYIEEMNVERKSGPLKRISLEDS